MDKPLNCTRCGIFKFSTMAGLFSHQRSRCQGRQVVVNLSNFNHVVGTVIDEGDVDEVFMCPVEGRIENDFPILLHEGCQMADSPLDPDMCNTQSLPNMDENVPLRPFDSTFHLINFVRNCKNKQGLSREDIKALLDLLCDDRFDPKALTVKNSDDIENYEEKELYPSSDGWTKYTFSQVENGNVDLHFKNPIQVLTSLFSAAENAKDFKLSATTNRSVTRERVYTTPDTGSWWHQMQDFINLQCNGAVIAPLIFYSDQTCLSNNTRISGYPLVITIGNISLENRREATGHELLAILPTFQGSNLSTSKKLEYLHQNLEIIFTSLKEASFTGLPLLDPSGEPQIVYPLLFAYICDHPESCKITASYDTNLCQSPCSRCMCGKDDLNNMHMQHPVRTESKMAEVYRVMECVHPNLAIEIGRTWSLHPIQCALWGFNGGHTELGNPYLAIHVDTLHQSDLGIFKMIVGILREVASIQPRERKLKELDRRLLFIKKNCRFPAFRIPGNEQGGYFVSQANFAGFEHRAVMQVIVPCLVGLFDENIISAIVLFLEWYGVACRSTSHTNTSLKRMDEQMCRAVDALKSSMFEWQKSRFNTSKVHMMNHFTQCIKRSGLPWEYSTDMYEQFHIALMKIAYRSSNRRNATPFIVRHNKRLQSLRRVAKQIEGLKNHKKIIDTPLKKALKTGQNVMSPIHANVHRLWLHRTRDEFSQTPRATLGDLRMGRGYELARVSVSIQKLLVDQPEIALEFLQALRIYELGLNVTLSQVLGLSRCLAVPPGAGEKYGDWPMYARATANFHGSPYFSNVAFEVEEVGIQHICYGQIRLLFHASSHSNIPGEQSPRQIELVFLKLYKEIENDEWSALTKCRCLRWTTQSNLRDVQNSMRRNSQADLRARYIVTDIQKILRVVHVIPNFFRPGRFFINRWKF